MENDGQTDRNPPTTDWAHRGTGPQCNQDEPNAILHLPALSSLGPGLSPASPHTLSWAGGSPSTRPPGPPARRRPTWSTTGRGRAARRGTLTAPGCHTGYISVCFGNNNKVKFDEELKGSRGKEEPTFLKPHQLCTAAWYVYCTFCRREARNCKSSDGKNISSSSINSGNSVSSNNDIPMTLLPLIFHLCPTLPSTINSPFPLSFLPRRHYKFPSSTQSLPLYLTDNTTYRAFFVLLPLFSPLSQKPSQNPDPVGFK